MDCSLATFMPQIGRESPAILALIFGGCCTNVYTLETIIRHNQARHSALALTFIQFVFVTVEGFVHFFHPSSRSLLRRPERQRRRWLGVAAAHFTISVLNNVSLEYHVSVPMHIVLRSGGGLVILGIGSIAGRRYSQNQWISVIVMTAGVVFAALNDANDGGNHTSTSYTGIFILVITQSLAALNGLLLENIYQQSPTVWREGLFYSHLLALPFFLPLLPKITAQLSHLAAGARLEISTRPPSQYAMNLPVQSLSLVLNALTQFLCVRGVSLLTSTSSALSVCMVLNARKVVSLLLSVHAFGIQIRGGFVFGTVLVFFSIILYAVDEWRRVPRAR